MYKLFTKSLDYEKSWTIDVYMKELGGYTALKKALKMEPTEIIDEVKTSNLRGRGGAGFPTGIKWSFMPQESDVPKYLVINADEGEPGTFKDRLIMERDPHALIEGCIISCWALGCETCYIYVRGELFYAIDQLEAAIEEAYSKKFLGKNILGSGFDLDMYVHPGAGAYICGEETALLESLEGKSGQPRMKPPYPASVGLFGCPTTVNNVETIACLPDIINKGGEQFASEGCERNGGIKMYGVSGHVVNPGVFEAPHGISMKELIYGEDYAGGLRDGRELKAAIPGGSSCPVLIPDEVDVSMDFDSLKTVGSLFGTGGVVVMDDQTCMVRVAMNLAHFYHFESCGQCTPCREGTGWMTRILESIESGHATEEDVDLLLDVCNNIEGNTICPHGDAAGMAVRSYVTKFADEFREHVRRGGCWFPEW